MNCEECFYFDDITGGCTKDNDECEDGSLFVKALEPQDMYKALYLLIFNMPFTIQNGIMSCIAPKKAVAAIPAESFEKFDDEKMKILIDYDPKTKRYIFETSKQPKVNLILLPKKIMRRKRLILGNDN